MQNESDCNQLLMRFVYESTARKKPTARQANEHHLNYKDFNMTARVSISPDNLPYLQFLAIAWNCDLSKALNYFLFQSRTQPATAPTAQFVQIPAQELYTEPVPQPRRFTPFEQIEPEDAPDPVIARLLALGLDEF